MPTGYTADVCSGKVTDPKEFVWQCARAFGAFLNQRDDPHDAPISFNEQPSTYAQKQIAEIEQRLSEVEAMSADEWEAFAANKRIEDEARYAEMNRKAAATRVTLVAMKQAVERMSIPHGELKQFAIEQLQSTIDFDGKQFAPRLFDKTREEYTADLRSSLDYQREQAQADIRRAESRNKWKRELAEAIGYPDNAEVTR